MCSSNPFCVLQPYIFMSDIEDRVAFPSELYCLVSLTNVHGLSFDNNYCRQSIWTFFHALWQISWYTGSVCSCRWLSFNKVESQIEPSHLMVTADQSSEHGIINTQTWLRAHERCLGSHKALQRLCTTMVLETRFVSYHDTKQVKEETTTNPFSFFDLRSQSKTIV